MTGFAVCLKLKCYLSIPQKKKKSVNFLFSMLFSGVFAQLVSVPISLDIWSSFFKHFWCSWFALIFGLLSLSISGVPDLPWYLVFFLAAFLVFLIASIFGVLSCSISGVPDCLDICGDEQWWWLDASPLDELPLLELWLLRPVRVFLSFWRHVAVHFGTQFQGKKTNFLTPPPHPQWRGCGKSACPSVRLCIYVSFGLMCLFWNIKKSSWRLLLQLIIVRPFPWVAGFYIELWGLLRAEDRKYHLPDPEVLNTVRFLFLF